MKNMRHGLVVVLVTLLGTTITLYPQSHDPKELFEQFHATKNDVSQRMALGNALLMCGINRYQNNELEQALSIFCELGKFFPTSSTILHNIGYTLAELNRPHEAIAAYKKALEYNPTNAETHVCLATALLATGNYKDGFAEYEWRWHQEGLSLDAVDVPRWTGQDLTNKTILLRTEGSLGDGIQFIRYAAELKKQGATVVVQTLEPLVALFSLCPYIDQVSSNYQSLPNADFQQSLMSLPYVLATTPDTVPNDPYLYATFERLVHWYKKMSSDKQYRIGICWQADPTNDAQRPRNAQRSIPLSACADLTTIPGLSWYSLQAIDGTEQLESTIAITSLNDNSFDNEHGRFMDTAAVMMNLHLIITVDTSIAHLAGALGRNVILILPYKADWRWGYQDETTCWYPTMNIIRASQPGCWNSVIETLRSLLSLPKV